MTVTEHGGGGAGKLPEAFDDGPGPPLPGIGTIAYGA